MQNEIQITSSPAVKSRLVEETHKRTAPNIKLVNFWTCWLLLLLLGICQVVQLQFRDFVQQGEGASLEAKLLFWVWIIPKEASMSRELGTYLSIVRRLHHDSMVSLVTPLFSAWLPLTTHILAILKKLCSEMYGTLNIDAAHVMKKHFLSAASDDFHRTIRQQHWSKSHPYSLIGQIHLWEFVR